MPSGETVALVMAMEPRSRTAGSPTATFVLSFLDPCQAEGTGQLEMRWQGGAQSVV